MDGLEKFKTRYRIYRCKVVGKSGEVDNDKVVLDRIELKKLTDQFDPDDVWNGDEIACYYQLCSDKTLADKNEKQKWLKNK